MTRPRRPRARWLTAAILLARSLAGCAIVGPSIEPAAQQRAICKYGYTAASGSLAPFNGLYLTGGEIAELADFYGPGEYDLAGFTVGVVERD